jgi:transcription elongation factor GreA
MIDEPTAAARQPLVRTPTLTRAEHDELVSELHELRARRRAELARRLREARDHGSPGEDGDVLSVLEEVSLDESRIAQLEDLVSDAPIVEMVDDGIAAVGCTVRVADVTGTLTEYRLVGRRRDDAGRHDVSPGSPMGTALIGTAAGDHVRVTLPNGRVRELHVLDVFPTLAPDAGERRAA